MQTFKLIFLMLDLFRLTFGLGSVLPPERLGVAETTQLWVSTLHPMPSELASASFLFQGLPSGLHVTDFYYKSEGQYRCEVMLRQLLERPGEAPELQTTLRYLALNTHLDLDKKPHLVMPEKERRQSLELLVRASKNQGLAGTKSVLLQTIKFYLTRESATSRSNFLHYLLTQDGPISKAIYQNVVTLSSVLVINSNVKPGWVHPFKIR